jgi:enoyl-CoA hydratase/carnithine racemase
MLADIVLAADTAAFQDSAHFMSGMLPGDGRHIVMPLLMGVNRGRYFLLTGQTLSAQDAKDLGLVAEVLPPERVLSRAWEHAEALAPLHRIRRRQQPITTQHRTQQFDAFSRPARQVGERAVPGLGVLADALAQQDGGWRRLGITATYMR